MYSRSRQVQNRRHPRINYSQSKQPAAECGERPESPCDLKHDRYAISHILHAANSAKARIRKADVQCLSGWFVVKTDAHHGWDDVEIVDAVYDEFLHSAAKLAALCWLDSQAGFTIDICPLRG